MTLSIVIIITLLMTRVILITTLVIGTTIDHYSFRWKVNLFRCVVASSQPVLDPPVPMEKAVQLNDANNDTCLALAQMDMYTFSVSARRWAPQPRGKCVQPGLIIKKCVPDAIKASFTVMITGRHLVCSNSYVKVSIRHTKWPACEAAGLYRICKLSGTTGSGIEGLITCFAKCTCGGDDCSHVTIHIPNLQEDWEICEISIE